MTVKLGRPTKMTLEVQDEILERIVKGESVARILKSHSKFPAYPNFLRFVEDDEPFRKRYTRAKEDQADFLAEEIIDIADDADADNVHAARLRVDARKWIAAKLKPKKYSDKVEQTIKGDAENPVAVIDLSNMTFNEKLEYLARNKNG